MSGTVTKLNLGLIGYGRMGHEIEQAAITRGHKISSIFDIDSPLKTSSIPSELDVLIDFSIPEAVFDNISAAGKSGKAIVIGTTGWTARLQEAKNLIEDCRGAALFATNFSLGINLFFRMVKHAATQMDLFPQYDVFVHEMHHREKIDSPSGTALHLGSIICAEMNRKEILKTNRSDGRIDKAALHISSTRCGSVPGTHIVGFESDGDSIELRHGARNRKGFATGAVLAAEWIQGKTGFFGIDNLIDSIIKGE